MTQSYILAIKARAYLVADPDGVPVALPAGRLEVAQEGDAPRREHGRAQLLARARFGLQEPACVASQTKL